MKNLGTLWLITLFCLIFPANVHAQEAEFDTTYNIEYTVSNSLEVVVKENIAVINQGASSVPSTFIETITNISVYDIKVMDSKDKEVVPEVEESGKSLIVRIPIENPAIGKGKKTEVTLSYKTRDLVQKTGRILNVTIPKAPVSSYMQEYNVAVKIPKDFGPQISITPKPVEEKMEEEGYVLLYNKQTLEKYGISASFGDYQIFDFEVSDMLKNDSLFAKTMEIPLPPPIADYQEISITEIVPIPEKLKKDADGNVLAVFKVPGRAEIKFQAKGKAKVYNRKISPTESESSDSLPGELRQYLVSRKYWETGDTLVKKIVSQNKSILEIYTYVTNNISYDFDAAEKEKIVVRKGAVNTLKDSKGLCLDFTDTFIALARTAGVPAREINGYAYTKDQRSTPIPLGISDNAFLHSWAQYYNPKYGWVSVDPTWGATSGLDYFSKLDNNHLAFVIKGLNPELPIPPKNIKVEFSTDDYFYKDDKYNLENLPISGRLDVSTFLFGAISVGLGLCTILVFARARLKAR